jgi:AcrR family transcriptional regulator
VIARRASTAPARPDRSPRVVEIVAAARRVLEHAGPGGLTMQSVADELHIRAPSLYKHVAGKDAIRVELLIDALTETGVALHAAVADAADDEADGDDKADGNRQRAVARLLAAYRRQALAHPEMYRLATAGRLSRDRLPSGLEDWAGKPFFLVTGDHDQARALWSFAHGTVILELDDRYPAGADLDATWAEGAAAFARTRPVRSAAATRRRPAPRR